MSLSSFLSEPELQGLDIEDPERIRRHQKILEKKPMMRGVFEDFYRLCWKLDQDYFGLVQGQRIELGAGVSFIKKLYPEVLVTDIKPAPHLDLVLDALKMDLPGESVRAFYGLNCFHHFPSPETFFKELIRVLKPGGGCILLDPFYGPFASLMYKRLFASESFDKNEKGWDSTDRKAMVGANQALSYIVFKRDRERFQREFPELEIAHARPVNNYLRYLFSGGLNFRQLLPDICIGPLRVIEAMLVPVNKLTALHHFVVLRKRQNQGGR